MGLSRQVQEKRFHRPFLLAIENTTGTHVCIQRARLQRPASEKKTGTSIVLGMKFSRELSVEQPLSRALLKSNDLLGSHIVLSSSWSKDLVGAPETKERRRQDEPATFTMTKIELCWRERKARRTRQGIAAARLWFHTTTAILEVTEVARAKEDTRGRRERERD